jgi:DNA-directed RNA polymerase subunit RPC12/RpoP
MAESAEYVCGHCKEKFYEPSDIVRCGNCSVDYHSSCAQKMNGRCEACGTEFPASLLSRWVEAKFGRKSMGMRFTAIGIALIGLSVWMFFDPMLRILSYFFLFFGVSSLAVGSALWGSAR